MLFYIEQAWTSVVLPLHTPIVWFILTSLRPALSQFTIPVVVQFCTWFGLTRGRQGITCQSERGSHVKIEIRSDCNTYIIH